MGDRHSQIHGVAGEIHRAFHPHRIVLCGSYAYGRPTKDSDVDFVVIMKTRKRNMRQALDISTAISHPFPMDLIVLKPGEARRRIRGGDLVLKEMLARGKVLHEGRHH